MTTNTEQSTSRRIAIVGTGAVGSSLAYALLIRGQADEIVLIDLNRARAEGEAMDLGHGLPFVRPVEVRAGDYSDCAGADIIIITAGAASRADETRLDLAARNVAIFRQIIPEIVKYNLDGILLVVTNPVDVLTYLTIKLAERPANKVIGSGTVLDSARFRYLLARHCGLDPRNVHAHVIGEHGDSETPVWSLANIAGTHLVEYCLVCGGGCSLVQREDIFRQVREAAYEVIQRKGATNYAIGLATVSIVESILRDQHSVLPVSSLIQGQYGLKDVCLSLPTVVGRAGVVKLLELPLNTEELKGLQRSAVVLQEVARSVGL
ncbi:MAG: L-lactate dehydrogenase [Chloroflexi bacterium]|nr:L-lactate dehydrogenase [Chloroflexota bacterium]